MKILIKDKINFIFEVVMTIIVFIVFIAGPIYMLWFTEKSDTINDLTNIKIFYIVYDNYKKNNPNAMDFSSNKINIHSPYNPKKYKPKNIKLIGGEIYDIIKLHNIKANADKDYFEGIKILGYFVLDDKFNVICSESQNDKTSFYTKTFDMNGDYYGQNSADYFIYIKVK